MLTYILLTTFHGIAQWRGIDSECMTQLRISMSELYISLSYGVFKDLLYLGFYAIKCCNSFGMSVSRKNESFGKHFLKNNCLN